MIRRHLAGCTIMEVAHRQATIASCQRGEAGHHTPDNGLCIGLLLLGDPFITIASCLYLPMRSLPTGSPSDGACCAAALQWW